MKYRHLGLLFVLIWPNYSKSEDFTLGVMIGCTCGLATGIVATAIIAARYNRQSEEEKLTEKLTDHMKAFKGLLKVRDSDHRIKDKELDQKYQDVAFCFLQKEKEILATYVSPNKTKLDATAGQTAPETH